GSRWPTTRTGAAEQALRITAYVHADGVELGGSYALVVRHPRLRFGQRSIDYRHYLRELAANHRHCGRSPARSSRRSGALLVDMGATGRGPWASPASPLFARVL